LDDDGDDEKTTRVDATRRTDPRAIARDDSLARESDETTFFIDDEDANLY